MRKSLITPQTKTFLFNILAFTPYILYISFVISNNQGPVDYETFMEIGSRLPLGKPVFEGNSYYPAAFVYLYTILFLLPRPVSMILWLATPVLVAWLIVGRKPWVLLYGPLFANFLGGQSAIFAMLGMWGYSQNRDLYRLRGGLWLGLILMKPHLAIFPILFALHEWAIAIITSRKIPKQALGFLCAGVIWYMVGVPIGWDWPIQWLINPRPESFRPQAGIIPRMLISLGVELNSPFFWIGTALGLIVLILFVYLINRKRMPLDLWMFSAACGFPFIHDYDLIQLIPFLNSPTRRYWAIIASIPLWVVMLFAYGNDRAWFVVTLIPPILILSTFFENSRHNSKD